MKSYVEFLSHPRTLAVLGASTNPQKAGHFVPKFLQERGFKIIPINPMTDYIFGEKTLESLDDLTEPVDGILIYRALPIAEEIALKAVKMKIPVIWLPEGITSNKVEHAAKEKGLLFVQDKCPKKEIEKLGIIVSS